MGIMMGSCFIECIVVCVRFRYVQCMVPMKYDSIHAIPILMVIDETTKDLSCVS